ncbi:hypothetical protein LX87_04103 [Larkinella arboricola]|uniref:Uncharacterized protein n=1 Tax=Larkinella arboricola TaxID=643671 RepID=A0A327WPD0_LARAB|nr:hypothetical protein [Larkinella arboricola]RAJ94218.1 hypothetical protein LX87_04103 [Larkinella arboricola]
MNKVRISIRDLFRSKASEDQKTTETTVEKPESTTEETTTDEGDEDEESDETETEETTTETETTIETTASEKGNVQVKEMSQDAYNALVADAKAWNDNKDRFAALVQWEAAIKGIGGKGASVDQNIQNSRTKPGVLDQPWNQAAMKAAGKAE